MRQVLVNAKLMPVMGLVYRPVAVSWEMFLRHLQAGFESYIGYEQTAKFLSEKSGLVIPLNRGETTVKAGDVMLICSLSYRMQDPTKKGQEVRTDFEYAVCQVTSE